MIETELAYMAGFFDGEGCIYIAKKKEKKGRFQLYCFVGQTNISILELFKLSFGGSIQKESPHKYERHSCYKWQVCSRQALVFLEAIYPCLKLKRMEAEVAIRFQKRKHYGKTLDAQKVIEEAESVLLKRLKDERQCESMQHLTGT